MTFILPQRQHAIAISLNPRRRSKILDRLNHARYHYSLARPADPISWRSTLSLLEELGAHPSVHIIADASQLDGTDAPLKSASVAYGHQFGAVLCSVPASLHSTNQSRPVQSTFSGRKRGKGEESRGRRSQIEFKGLCGAML